MSASCLAFNHNTKTSKQRFAISCIADDFDRIHPHVHIEVTCRLCGAVCKDVSFIGKTSPSKNGTTCYLDVKCPECGHEYRLGIIIGEFGAK